MRPNLTRRCRRGGSKSQPSLKETKVRRLSEVIRVYGNYLITLPLLRLRACLLVHAHSLSRGECRRTGRLVGRTKIQASR